MCTSRMRTLPCVAICRNATTRGDASSHVSLFPLQTQYGDRWAAHGRQTAAMRRAPRRQSRRGTMLPSSISSSGSPTTLPSLLSRLCHAAARGTSQQSALRVRTPLPKPNALHAFGLVRGRCAPSLLLVYEHSRASELLLVFEDSGGEGAWDHVSSWLRHATCRPSTWSRPAAPPHGLRRS